MTSTSVCTPSEKYYHGLIVALANSSFKLKPAGLLKYTANKNYMVLGILSLGAGREAEITAIFSSELCVLFFNLCIFQYKTCDIVCLLSFFQRSKLAAV